MLFNSITVYPLTFFGIAKRQLTEIYKVLLPFSSNFMSFPEMLSQIRLVSVHFSP